MSNPYHGSNPKRKRTRLYDCLFWSCLIIIGGLFVYAIWRMQ